MNLLKFLQEFIEFQKKYFNKTGNMKSISALNHKTGMSKTIMTGNMTLEFNSKLKQKSELVTENARKILKKYVKEPEKILEFIEAKGTIVIKAPFMDKVLAYIGRDEGFVTPVKGFKAIFLIAAINLLSKQKLSYSTKTPAMFVMRNLPVNMFSIAHQFHHWMAYIQNLPGYDYDTIENFDNLWSVNTLDDIEKLSIEEIISLRTAIARDLEAIAFVKSFTREQAGSKSSLEKIKQGQKVNL